MRFDRHDLIYRLRHASSFSIFFVRRRRSSSSSSSSLEVAGSHELEMRGGRSTRIRNETWLKDIKTLKKVTEDSSNFDDSVCVLIVMI